MNLIKTFLWVFLYFVFCLPLLAGQEHPKKSSNVDKTPLEGNINHISYFLLQISQPLGHDVTVDYTTRDVSAIANFDYISVTGTATINMGERSTIIGIEIIGDLISELNETFQLVISNPKGATFPEGISEITAIKTIIDDDSDLTNTLPNLIAYNFTVQSSKNIIGINTDNTFDGYNCSGGINSEDSIDRLTLVSQFYQNGCYTAGEYNHNNYLVEHGIVSDTSGQLNLI